MLYSSVTNAKDFGITQLIVTQVFRIMLVRFGQFIQILFVQESEDSNGETRVDVGVKLIPRWQGSSAGDSETTMSNSKDRNVSDSCMINVSALPSNEG